MKKRKKLTKAANPLIITLPRYHYIHTYSQQHSQYLHKTPCQIQILSFCQIVGTLIDQAPMKSGASPIRPELRASQKSLSTHSPLMWYEWMDSDHMPHFIIFFYLLTQGGVLRIEYISYVINISFYLFTQTLLPNMFIHFIWWYVDHWHLIFLRTPINRSGRPGG